MFIILYCHILLNCRKIIQFSLHFQALRLSKTALGTTPPGKIINLMASDVERFTWAFYFINYIWIAPLLALIVGVILYMKIGNFAFVGIATILVVTVVQGKIKLK